MQLQSSGFVEFMVQVRAYTIAGFKAKGRMLVLLGCMESGNASQAWKFEGSSCGAA